MDFTLDITYDKKKTRAENSEAIYESMFKKNIPQHKSISKFLFCVYGNHGLIANRFKNLKPQ